LSFQLNAQGVYKGGARDGNTMAEYSNFISDIKKPNVLQCRIYPNPVNQKDECFYIEVSTERAFSVLIYNTLGKVLYYNNKCYLNNLQLNLSDFQAGVYYIKIESGKDCLREKLVVY
jgi:hypothetical protein